MKTKQACPFFGNHFSFESTSFLEQEFQQTGATTEECQKCEIETKCKIETENKVI
jgi:hypothetical protein